MGAGRGTVAVIASCVALLAAALPSSALAGASGDPFIVSSAKQPNGAYSPEGWDVSVKEGKAKSFFFQVSTPEPGGVAVEFSDSETGVPPGYRLRWFKGKSQTKEITDQVSGEGYDMTVPQNGQRYLNARVKNRNAKSAMCLVGTAANKTFSEYAYFSINGLCSF